MSKVQYKRRDQLEAENQQLKATIAQYETKFKNAKAYLNEQLAEIEKRGSDES